VLIPLYGPLGAAIATAGSLVLHNLLNQWWLVRTTDVKLFDAGYAATLTSIIVATCILVGTQQTLTLHVGTSLGLTALVSLAVLYWNREVLELGGVFPALSRFSLFHKLRRSPGSHH
jgi:O-antigen/teichoic acid export membrane protein